MPCFVHRKGNMPMDAWEPEGEMGTRFTSSVFQRLLGETCYRFPANKHSVLEAQSGYNRRLWSRRGITSTEGRLLPVLQTVVLSFLEKRPGHASILFSTEGRKCVSQEKKHWGGKLIMLLSQNFCENFLTRKQSEQIFWSIFQNGLLFDMALLIDKTIHYQRAVIEMLEEDKNMLLNNYMLWSWRNWSDVLFGGTRASYRIFIGSLLTIKWDLTVPHLSTFVPLWWHWGMGLWFFLNNGWFWLIHNCFRRSVC